MANDDDDLQELVRDFVVESREHLETVETDLLRLEQGTGDADTVNNVFRCVHSVKGVAGFLGLGTIQALAHALESTLDLVRKERLLPSGELVGVLLDAIDGLSALIENVAEANGADISRHVAALQEFRDAADGGGGPAPTSAAAPPVVAVVPAASGEPAPAASAAEAAPERAQASPGPRRDGESSGAESIRVHVDLLNRLMNLSGELVLGRNQVLQSIRPSSDRSLQQAVQSLSQVVSEVQEAIMQTRLQPVAHLFQRFPRVVRDLSTKLKKQCRLLVEGKEVELDRSILEALADPLTHVVRNSLDHGIERPEVRRQKDKPPEGTLQLQAFHQGGHVKIRISDDGAGIDPQRTRKKAVEKGLLTPEQAAAMSDRDAVMLIFAPGFSTAEQVSDVSGRGVGMDVVRSNIERVGGHVDVQTEVGRGTTMTITIPLTLAILPAMVVSCAGRRYVLPQSNVTELVRVRDRDRDERIVVVRGREVLRLRGALLPLLRLRRALGVGEADPPPAALDVIVVQANGLRYGLVIDAPPDTEEIVVKPLGAHLRKRQEYSGSTILGDGRVALILDVTGLAAAVGLEPREADDTDVAGRAEDGAQPQVEPADFVIFRTDPNEHFAVPLGLVSRIQRIAVGEVQTIGGDLVHRHGDRLVPVVRVEQHVAARAFAADGERAMLVVLRVHDAEVAFLASAIDDIESVDQVIDMETLRAPGVLGSFALGDATVRLLDASAIARRALPRLGSAAEAAAPATKQERERGPLRVLFAEDSAFFRTHVARVMREGGLEVSEAVDGEAAWQTLCERSGDFDLVVTDVQMPRCDGIELTRRIRGDARTTHLPVVVLSSLSTDDDVAAGRAAGATEYLVKLDDASLLAAVRRVGGGAD